MLMGCVGQEFNKVWWGWFVLTPQYPGPQLEDLNSGGWSHVEVSLFTYMPELAWLGTPWVFPEPLCSFSSLHMVLFCVFCNMAALVSFQQSSSVIQEQMFQQNGKSHMAVKDVKMKSNE